MLVAAASTLWGLSVNRNRKLGVMIREGLLMVSSSFMATSPEFDFVKRLSICSSTFGSSQWVDFFVEIELDLGVRFEIFVMTSFHVWPVIWWRHMVMEVEEWCIRLSWGGGDDFVVGVADNGFSVVELVEVDRRRGRVEFEWMWIIMEVVWRQY